MTKNVRLAILRASHDSTAKFSDQAANSMMWTGPNAVLEYWRDVTTDYLDFVDSAVMPWVDIQVGADTSRATVANLTIDALRNKFPGRDPLEGFSGVVVLVNPGTMVIPNPRAGQPGQAATITQGFDGGATNTRGFPVAVLPVMASDHTFMCHELGHVMGFDHTYGLLNNGADWDQSDANIVADPVYGSPYDLMSSASFGSRWLGTGDRYSSSPTFNVGAVDGWPNPNAYSAGPALSRANLHRWMPEALGSLVVDKNFPTGDGDRQRTRLWGFAARRAPALLILHPQNEGADGVGRVYVEFRPRTSWDQGLDVVGPDLAREGVVVHSLENVTGAGPRVWYRGSVPTNSADKDVMLSGTSLAVEVDAFDPEGQWVDVVVRLRGLPDVQIVYGNHSDDFVGVIGDTVADKTPCQDEIRRGTFATSSFTQFRLSATGLGAGGAPVAADVTASWTVAGVPISGNSGTVSVPFEGSSFNVDFTIDPVNFELALTSRGGERYQVPVEARVSDQMQFGTASSTFVAQGWFEGIHPEDEKILGDCIGRIMKEHNVRQPVFRKPTPDPTWGGHDEIIKNTNQWAEKAQHTVERVTVDQAVQKNLGKLINLQRGFGR